MSCSSAQLAASVAPHELHTAAAGATPLKSAARDLTVDAFCNAQASGGLMFGCVDQRNPVCCIVSAGCPAACKEHSWSVVVICAVSLGQIRQWRVRRRQQHGRIPGEVLPKCAALQFAVPELYASNHVSRKQARMLRVASPCTIQMRRRVRQQERRHQPEPLLQVRRPAAADLHLVPVPRRCAAAPGPPRNDAVLSKAVSTRC